MKYLLLILFFIIDLFGQAQGRWAKVEDYFKKLRLDEIPGDYSNIKFGGNPDVDGAETIWAYGGMYNWPDSADTLFISSSNADDTNYIVMSGLGEDSLFRQDTIKMQGQTKIKCCPPDTSKWYRNDRAFIINTRDDLQGNVYLYHPSTVTAGVPDDNTKIVSYIAQGGINQTEQMFYTVPCDRIGLFWGTELHLIFGSGGGGSQYIDGRAVIRDRYGPWRYRYDFSIIGDAGPFKGDPKFPRVLSPCSDIEFGVVDVSGLNLKISGEFYIITVDTNFVRAVR